MNFTELLKNHIQKSLENSYLDVRDLTGEGNHLELVVVSEKFRELNRIARQQLIMSLIKDLWANGLHALTMKTWTPEEWEKQKPYP
jgi:acid stress-induced BolA-like protein IbaG/YrbA